MNTAQKRLSSALIAVAALTAVTAFAESNDAYPVQPKTSSTVTRAQVAAETLKAEKRGDVPKNDHLYPAEKHAKTPGKSRAQVKSELKAAETAGLTPQIGKDYPASSK